MKRILFVDDEPSVLEELKAMMSDLEGQWDMAFIDNGPRALELMLKTPFDAIVADATMPGMDGAQLFTWVMKRFPRTVRIAGAHDLEAESSKALVGLAHQFLGKPYEPSRLREAVEKSLGSRQQLLDGKLKEVVSQIRTLPSVPAVYLELMKELKEDDPSVPRMGHLIAQDVGLTAKVLQLVNSAYFGLPQQVSNPAEAMFYLGIGSVKNIVLGVQSFAQFDKVVMPYFSLEQLWQHSWRTGALARQLVLLENRSHLADDVFTAGLLHDIGKLVLATGLPDHYRKVMESYGAQPRPMAEIEAELIGATHADLGGYLLGLWGLPAGIVEGVGWHHRPSGTGKKEFSVATALHVANALDHQQAAPASASVFARMDLEHLAAVGLTGRDEVWRTEVVTERAA